jgi:DnaJ-class molecular chaperone
MNRKECPTCHGKGIEPCRNRNCSDGRPHVHVCELCEGTGNVFVGEIEYPPYTNMYPVK